MAVNHLNISDFMLLAKLHPVFDVRSEDEYIHAHIPNAFSLPIFNSNQRAEIGTTYKQISRQQAIKLGLNYFGLNLNNYINKVETTLVKQNITDNKLLVHCWRGGMRSAAMAWLLSFNGYEVYLLEGGYKAYRNWVLKQLECPFTFYTVSGFAGSGKTDVLNYLKKTTPVINLEEIACHRGSAFGALGMPQQPGQEQFENILVQHLSAFYTITNNLNLVQPKPILIEKESQRIGLVNLPNTFYNNMQQSKTIFLSVNFASRLNRIVEEYGSFEKEKLINAVIRIQKKLGGLAVKQCINALLENDVRACFEILLTYYDREYSKYKNNQQALIINEDSLVNMANQMIKIINE